MIRGWAALSHAHGISSLVTLHTRTHTSLSQALKDAVRSLQSQLSGSLTREVSLARQLDAALVVSAG